MYNCTCFFMFRCPAYSFQCVYVGCIEKKKVCNDHNDCRDASDEDVDLCKSLKPSEPVSPKPKPSQVTRRPILRYLIKIYIT